MTVTVDGATWENGELCFYADHTDMYMFHVVATNDCGEVTCDVVVNVELGVDAVIDCPTEDLGVVLDVSRLFSFWPI